jgi:hypothetical protein
MLYLGLQIISRTFSAVIPMELFESRLPNKNTHTPLGVWVFSF